MTEEIIIFETKAEFLGWLLNFDYHQKGIVYGSETMLEIKEFPVLTYIEFDSDLPFPNYIEFIND